MKLEQIQIPKPCTPPPGVLSGCGATLFCSDCKKHVHDLSQMSRAEGEKLLSDSGGHVCVQYSTDTAGKILTRETLSRRQWLGRSLAAAMAWVSIGAIVSGCRTNRGAPVRRAGAIAPPTQVLGEAPLFVTTGLIAPPTSQIVMGKVRVPTTQETP